MKKYIVKTEILQYLTINGTANLKNIVSDISELTGRSKKAIESSIYNLLSIGLIKKEKRGVYYRGFDEKIENPLEKVERNKYIENILDGKIVKKSSILEEICSEFDTSLNTANMQFKNLIRRKKIFSYGHGFYSNTPLDEKIVSKGSEKRQKYILKILEEKEYNSLEIAKLTSKKYKTPEWIVYHDIDKLFKTEKIIKQKNGRIALKGIKRTRGGLRETKKKTSKEVKSTFESPLIDLLNKNGPLSYKELAEQSSSVDMVMLNVLILNGTINRTNGIYSINQNS